MDDPSKTGVRCNSLTKRDLPAIPAESVGTQVKSEPSSHG